MARENGPRRPTLATARCLLRRRLFQVDLSFQISEKAAIDAAFVVPICRARVFCGFFWFPAAKSRIKSGDIAVFPQAGVLR